MENTLGSFFIVLYHIYKLHMTVIRIMDSSRGVLFTQNEFIILISLSLTLSLSLTTKSPNTNTAAAILFPLPCFLAWFVLVMSWHSPTISQFMKSQMNHRRRRRHRRLN